MPSYATRYDELFASFERTQGVDAKLLKAVAAHESSLDPLAWKPEPRYEYLWDVKLNQPFRRLVNPEEAFAKVPPKDFPAPRPDVSPVAEWWGQQASWGLMQIMGAAARERGFVGPYLTALADPLEGLRWGVAHLFQFLKRARLSSPDPAEQEWMTLTAYNHGWGPVAGWRRGGAKPDGAYAEAVLAVKASL